MPHVDGLQAAGQIASALPHIPILLYTQHAVSAEAKMEAKKLGVLEVVIKEAPDQLLRAVEAAQSSVPAAEKARTATSAATPGPDLLPGPEEN